MATKNSSATRSFARRLLGVCVLVGLVIGGSIFFWLQSRPTINTNKQGGHTQVSASVLVEQAEQLRKAFQRMVALGWNAFDITYGDGGPADLLKTQKMVEDMLPPAGTTAFADAVWRLGGGRLLAVYPNNLFDLAFFLPGLTQSACQSINAQLWQDAEGAPPRESGTALRDWQNGQADVLELFGGRNRAEACVKTKEGLYLYYKTTFSPKADMPPPPTIAPAPPKTDPELTPLPTAPVR
jgi:hypothetical protein